MPPEGERFDYKVAVGEIAAKMCRLGTGDLAQLRRMEVGGPGCSAFWQLASAGGVIDAAPITPWMRIIKIMAILTPKGERAKGIPLHDDRYRLGGVLCDGGDPGWKDATRPFVSETRLARFLSQPPDHHGEALERIARALANRRVIDRGLNCADIAALLLFPESKTSAQALATSYYRRLDSALRTDKT